MARTAYQPTEEQNRRLQEGNLDLYWIVPDGRSVFGAIAHLKDRSTSEVIAQLLFWLEEGHQEMRALIEAKGLTIDQVLGAIRLGDVELDDLMMMTLVAYSEALPVTVLLPDGRTQNLLATPGAMVVRVANPRPHYHATRQSPSTSGSTSEGSTSGGST